MCKRSTAGAVMIVAAATAVATHAETTLTPDIQFSADHSSNRRLLLDNAESVSGYVGEANLGLKNDTPTWTQTLDTQLQSRHYRGGADLGSDDQNLAGKVLHKGATTKTEVRANLINDTTLTDQRDFSGYTEELKRRRYSSAGFGQQWQWSPRNLWLFDYDASRAKYRDAGDTNLVDYRFDTASTSFQHGFSEALASYVSLAESDYDASAVGNTSLSRDLSLGTHWQPSEATTSRFGVGQRRTEYSYYDGLVEIDDRFNYFTVELARDLPGGKVSVKTQDVSQPTGDGSVYRTRKVSVDYFTHINSRQILSVSAAYSQQRASAQQFSDTDRNNSQLTLSYRYRLGRDFGLQTVLTYRDQTYVSENDLAASNDIWLGVYWTPIPYRW